MGPLFRNWINSGVLGVYPVSEDEFNSNNENAILEGSDAVLLDFAKCKLGYRYRRLGRTTFVKKC